MKSDSFPIPQIDDDCIDKIGQAKFVSKLDLLKGYWQVLFTERAKNLSAFVTPADLYQYNVIPFGMNYEVRTCNIPEINQSINTRLGRMQRIY